MKNEILARRLKEERKKRGWTLKELSKRSGVAYGSIGHFERGERLPRTDTLEKLAKTFRVTTDELMNDPHPLKDIASQAFNQAYIDFEGEIVENDSVTLTFVFFNSLFEMEFEPDQNFFEIFNLIQSNRDTFIDKSFNKYKHVYIDSPKKAKDIKLALRSEMFNDFKKYMIEISFIPSLVLYGVLNNLAENNHYLSAYRSGKPTRDLLYKEKIIWGSTENDDDFDFLFEESLKFIRSTLCKSKEKGIITSFLETDISNL